MSIHRMPDGRPVEHLGDGVYAAYDRCGGIELRANDHLQPTDVVYLEPAVIEALLVFRDHCREEAGKEGGA